MRKSDQLAGNHIAVWEFIGLPPSAGGGQDDEEQECDAESDREQATSGDGRIPWAPRSCVWLGSVGQEDSKAGLRDSAGVLAVTIAGVSAIAAWGCGGATDGSTAYGARSRSST